MHRWTCDRFSGINSRIAESYQVGRVILVGDAAHVHSPMGGPGLNLGLQDAVNLGWKLAAVLRGASSPACSPPMKANAGPPPSGWSCTAAPNWLLFRPGPEVTALRELFSELITEPAVVQPPHRSGVRGGKSLSPGPRAAHPFAGHWVPDFAVTNGDGTRRIAELARDGRPLLVDLTEAELVAASVADVADQFTVVAGRPVGDVAAIALLVRPDGYVAWATSCDNPDIGELRGELVRWFGMRAAYFDLSSSWYFLVMWSTA